MPNLPKVHRPKWMDQAKRRADNERAKRNQRKRCYSTGHPTWRKLRAYVLAREPLCRECRKEGRTTPATVVDHIDGDSFNNATTNLQPLCAKHHGRLTALHDGSLGNPINRRGEDK
ncbi:MAG: HNH endonuclease signature motif containing protein [Lysobacterales bacterium]